ncbi:MAG: hypothetical protein COY58_06940 [Gammaproteobacteria bacterium CG_4_10_14_0_8_um_filter_38_16]|nr:MAG: hypothetical protein COY58_06940 [Gammaproteobacteria bacterium CG_4_10_14_0_8_um_filter_38_16]PJA04198.1 MAG: hypothetical protein COX72_01085 [Gammaproteobacteria bacterium CG_4_10_14_0_2_um_filter_38_22]PJB11034.1 MAG: hypothetical protein CO120_01585 [Gammaproteobacteria bacterium CG_4_9_14_3_um_filter_38_9]
MTREETTQRVIAEALSTDEIKWKVKQHCSTIKKQQYPNRNNNYKNHFLLTLAIFSTCAAYGIWIHKAYHDGIRGQSIDNFLAGMKKATNNDPEKNLAFVNAMSVSEMRKFAWMEKFPYNFDIAVFFILFLIGMTYNIVGICSTFFNSRVAVNYSYDDILTALNINNTDECAALICPISLSIVMDPVYIERKKNEKDKNGEDVWEKIPGVYERSLLVSHLAREENASIPRTGEAYDPTNFRITVDHVTAEAVDLYIKQCISDYRKNAKTASPVNALPQQS